MVDIIKKNMSEIWASSGDVQAPEAAKIRTGWVVEAVPRQWWNWFENRQDTNIAYMLQKGIPEWDAETEYLTNKSYVQRNNVVYKCILTGTDKDPATTPANWVKAFPESTPYLETVKGTPVVNNTMLFINSAGVATNSTVGSTGLSVLGTTSAGDARSVISAQQSNANLSMLSATSAATNTLPYYTSASAMGTTSLTAFGRSMIAQGDAVSARSLLGLGTAAVYNITTSRYDTTTGAIVKVGDFGLGSKDNAPYVGLAVNPDAYTTSSFYIGQFTINGINRSGWLLVYAGSDASVCGQTFLNGDGATFSRTKSAGVWATWIESWTTVNLVKTQNNLDNSYGRLLQVGDFGIGRTNVLRVNIDNPALIPNGMYYVDSSTTGTKPPNAPEGNMIMMRQGDNGIASRQVYFTNTAQNMFIRFIGGPGSTWSDWVEIYHSGNTAALVAQVVTGVQPTLDTKVSKTGDTMTGSLVLNGNPYVSLVQNPGQSLPKLEFHRAGVTAGMLYMNTNSLLAVSATGGQGTPQADVWTVNVTNGNTVQNGNLYAAGQINSGSAISAVGSVSGAGGTAVLANGQVQIFPASQLQAQNGYLWFYGPNASATRGIIYADSANTLRLQAGTSLALTLDSGGGATFANNVSVGAGINATNNVSGQDLVARGAVYAGNGTASLQPTGDVYGSIYGGGGLSGVLNSIFARNQTWTDVTSQRALTGTYTNSTGKPIMLAVYATYAAGAYDGLRISINGGPFFVFTACDNATAAARVAGTVVIPVGATYVVQGISVVFTLASWWELR